MSRRALLFVAFLLGCTTTESIYERASEIRFGADSLTLSPGESVPFDLAALDDAGNAVYHDPLLLEVRDTLVVRLVGDDTLTAVGVGATWLVARSGDVVDSVPVRVVSSWVGVASYLTSSGCLLRGGASPWCWNNSAPTLLAGAPVLVSISGTDDHACGLTAAGAAYCIGNGSYGQLGLGYAVGNVTEFAAVAGGHTFATISTGYAQSCGVTTDGVGLCWGTGPLGVGDTVTRWEPDTVAGGHQWSALQSWVWGGCGITTAKALYCWGIAIPAADSVADSTVPHLITGLPPVVSIAFDGYAPCALGEDGTVWCWRYDRFSAVYVDAPTQLIGAPSFTALFGGGETFCGLDQAGAAWCWGYTLGDGSFEPSATPRPVSGGHQFVRLSGGYGAWCGLTPGGAAWCWGQLPFWDGYALVPRRMLDP